MSLLWKRNWCLPEGLFQSNILVRETQSKLSKRASKLKKGVFCLTLTLSKHSFQKTHLGNTLASRRSPMEKDCFRCGLFSGSSRTPFFTDLSPACSVNCGLQSCPTCQEQQLEHSLWLQCEWRRACDDLKNGQVGREQSTNKSS